MHCAMCFALRHCKRELQRAKRPLPKAKENVLHFKQAKDRISDVINQLTNSYICPK